MYQNLSIVRKATDAANAAWPEGRNLCERRSSVNYAYFPYIECLLENALKQVHNQHSKHLQRVSYEKILIDKLQAAFNLVKKYPEKYSTHHIVSALIDGLLSRKYSILLWDFRPRALFEETMIYDIFDQLYTENEDIMAICADRIEEKNKKYQQRTSKDKSTADNWSAKALDSTQRTINDLNEKNLRLKVRASFYANPSRDKKRKNSFFSQRESSLSLSLCDYPTEGDGNCFFHLYGKKNERKKYAVQNAQGMRQDWADLLNLFSSLKDMPPHLRSSMETIFEMFYERPTLMPKTIDKEIFELRKQISKKIKLAKLNSKVLIEQLKEKISEKSESAWPLILALLKNSVTRTSQAQHDIEEEIREWYKQQVKDDLFPGEKSLLSIQELLSRDEAWLTNRLNDELKQYAQLLDREKFKDFDEEYHVDTIKKGFTHDKGLFDAYRIAILSSSYYVFVEEFLLLATLTNTTLRLWYIESSGQPACREIAPHPDLQREIKKLPWQPKILPNKLREIAIFHRGFFEDGETTGNHFSRANEQYLQFIASQTVTLHNDSSTLTPSHHMSDKTSSGKQTASSRFSVWSKPAMRTVSYDPKMQTNNLKKTQTHKQENFTNTIEQLKNIFGGVNNITYIKENAEVQIIFDSRENFREGQTKLFEIFGEPSATDNYDSRDWRILSADDDTLAISYNSVRRFIEANQHSTSVSLSRSL
jgi:hypothetical protein